MTLGLPEYFFRATTVVPRWSSISTVAVITDMLLSRPSLPTGSKLANVERVPLWRKHTKHELTRLLRSQKLQINDWTHL